ncbi:hypothetical protein QFZ81_002270 [Paenibacillus sp. V4I9]|nr:hypothetical protein [Paenibacillus sp. V4I9]
MGVNIFWAITHLYFGEYPESNKFRWRNDHVLNYGKVTKCEDIPIKLRYNISLSSPVLNPS